jgi:hypothetical protein
MGEAGATTVRSMINSCGLCTSSCRRDADARHLANKYAAILDRLMRDQVSPQDLRIAQGGRCMSAPAAFDRHQYCVAQFGYRAGSEAARRPAEAITASLIFSI